MSLKPCILVAEDDGDIREVIRARLRSAGYDTVMARNGVEALDRIRAYAPVGMVLDINMPEMDGFTVLKTLREGRMWFPPTLVLTARHAAEDVRRAVELGAKDYLAKPFSEAQLLARITRLMRPVLGAPPEKPVML
jgi:two-component system OmpR family response regulator